MSPDEEVEVDSVVKQEGCKCLEVLFCVNPLLNVMFGFGCGVGVGVDGIGTCVIFAKCLFHGGGNESGDDGMMHVDIGFEWY